jgi:deazaflavin-dependent oxidoreductase (nitroreductase family)
MTDVHEPASASPRGLKRRFYRAPIAIYRAHLGALLGKRFLLLRHVGRVSGRVRDAVLEVVDRDAGSWTVVAGLGPRTSWYRNLLQHPEATIVVGSRTVPVIARPLPHNEGVAALEAYGRRHPRALRALGGAVGLPAHPTDDDFERVADRLPFVQLRQRADGAGGSGLAADLRDS